MPIPLLTTPTADSSAKCAACGTALVRTGKPITFADIGGTTASVIGGKPTRGHRAFKGWVPSLLIAVCPVCDTAAERTDEPTPEPPEVAAIRESYLERLGREHDAKESTDA